MFPEPSGKYDNLIVYRFIKENPDRRILLNAIDKRLIYSNQFKLFLIGVVDGILASIIASIVLDIIKGIEED